jgi:hypothetical protein
MALVAWILAVVGAGLAFAVCGGGATGLTRRVDRTSALAVTPLPAMAMYFTASDLYALVQAGTPLRGLIFVGGPFAIGLCTFLAIIWSVRAQADRRDWS